jgi:signal transduction histidine kinase
MSNIDRRPAATPAGSRTATRPLDPVSVAQGTTEVFRRLVHELAGLVDGSLRYIRLAQRDPRITSAVTTADHLGAASAALDRAASLLHDAMRTGADSLESVGAVLAHPDHAHSIHETIAHAIAVITPAADDRRITITADIADALTHRTGCPVYPIVSNAVRNAVDASPAGSTVVVRAIIEPGAPDHLFVEVIDAGPGVAMPEELMFAPGYTTKPAGSGLGLAIARDIAEQLGGEIHLDHRPDPPGARFTLRVPVPPAQTPGAPIGGAS